MQYKVTHNEIKKIIKHIIRGLPKPIKKRFQNVFIIVQSKPTKKQLKTLREKNITLYGLYEGIPYSNRSIDLPFELPSKITIFKSEIEKTCKTKEEVIKAIKETLYHEIGHYFGFPEKDLRKLGL
jgi:predicted Zn-dependent protease with MMP-like domain